MLADVLLFGLLFLAVFGLAGLVWRKLPVLKLTNPSQVAGAHAKEVKRQLVELRLKRQLVELGKWLRVKLSPLLARVQNMNWGARWRALEASVSERLRARAPEVRTLEDFLAQADEQLSGGELAVAEQSYLEALRLEPHCLPAYQGLGDVYLEARDYEQAREVYEYLVRRGSAQVSALGLARVASGQGKLEEARGQYLASLSISTAVQPRLELARILRELGRLGEAIEQVKEARAFEPNNPKILDIFIELSILNGQPEQAQEALGVLRQVNPENNKIAGFVEAIRALSTKLTPRTRAVRRSRATNFGVKVPR